MHDRRPVIAVVDKKTTRFLVVPYARPMACHCGEGEHVAAGLKCDVHDCCTKELELILCDNPEPCPEPAQYHIYEQAPSLLRARWWPIGAIDERIAAIDTSKAMAASTSTPLFVKARAVYLEYRVEAQQQISELTQAAGLVEQARALQLRLTGLEPKEQEKALDRVVGAAEERYLDVCVRSINGHSRLCAALELWGRILARCLRNGSTIDGIEPEVQLFTQTQEWYDLWSPCIPRLLSPSSSRKLESVLVLGGWLDPAMPHVSRNTLHFNTKER